MPALPVEVLVGPVAGLAVLLVISWQLWKVHQAHDLDVRTQRDAAIEISRGQVEATNRLADALEVKLKSDAARHRRADR